jgi:hypothetical protein
LVGFELFDLGIGPDTLFGGDALCGPKWHGASLFAWSLTLLGAATIGAALADAPGALSSLWAFRHDLKGGTVRTPAGVAWCSALLLIASLFTTPYFFDRYLIPVLFFAGAGWAAVCVPRIPRSSWILLAALIAFDLAGVQDCLARRAIATRAIRELFENGVDPLQINAGLEFAGVYRFTPIYRGPLAFQGPHLALTPEMERRDLLAAYFPLSYYRADAEYTVGWKPVPEQSIAKEYKLGSWTRQRTLFVSKRTVQRRD